MITGNLYRFAICMHAGMDTSANSEMKQDTLRILLVIGGCLAIVLAYQWV